jgi:cyclopropane-fatty-acyl-phospholipid synthase
MFRSNQPYATCYSLLQMLEGAIQHGALTIRTPDGAVREFGDGQGLTAELTVARPELFERILREGDVGIGESYAEGWWEVADDDLVSLLGIFFTNDLRAAFRGNWRRQAAIAFAVVRQRNSIRAAKDNVHRHYDLSNEFFSAFLDESMTYSCGFMDSLDDSLSTMQLHKYEIICRKLDLQPGERLLDIGCGWGGLMIYAALTRGVNAVGVTLSGKQASWAQSWIDRCGLSARVEVRVQDYRSVEGEFDKVVSVGMFEHVGREHQRTFVHQSLSTLRPGGRVLLHTIGTTGRRTPSPWLRKHIFPGVALPHLNDIVELVTDCGGSVGHVDNWKLHYAATTARWRERFVANRAAIAELGFDEQFLRSWDFYLQLLQACFRYDSLQLYQVLYGGSRSWAAPTDLTFATFRSSPTTWPSGMFAEQAESE